MGTGNGNEKNWIYTEFNVLNMGNYMGKTHKWDKKYRKILGREFGQWIQF